MAAIITVAAVVLAAPGQSGAAGPIPVGSVVKGLAWGWNIHGQVGDGSFVDRGSPVLINGAAQNMVQVSSGFHFNVARMADGTVRWWGFGSGTTVPSASIPGGLSGITQVSAGGTHILAVSTSGTVWAWGGNEYGQRGYGSAIDYPTVPQPVTAAGGGFSKVAAGATHSLALRSNGTVVAWGANTFGQLGDGTNQYRAAPVEVTGLSSVTHIAAGDGFSLARRSDGTLWAWGGNGVGQLGIGNRTPQYAPVQVPGLVGVTQVAAGAAHGMAIAGTSGSVWTWGDYLATNVNVSPVPVAVSGATQIDAGQYASAAVLTDGSLWTWGHHLHGSLGIGTVSDIGVTVAVPTRVAVPHMGTGSSPVVQVALGVNSGLVVAVTATTVPSIVGMTVPEAAQTLGAAGLVIGTQGFADSCEDVGLVVSQARSSGSQVAIGTPININIGRKPPRSSCL